MVVCPVCEHAQAGGSECEVCGARLPVPPAFPEAEPSIAPMEGLEPTFQAAVPALAPELFPGLEPTAAAPVSDPLPAGIPDLEPTRTAHVDPPVAPLTEVERIGDGAPAEERTPYPAVVVCRYCRTEAALGAKLCERCGMRLPTAELPAPEPLASEARMCSCGTPIRGPRCPSCGARTG